MTSYRQRINLFLKPPSPNTRWVKQLQNVKGRTVEDRVNKLVDLLNDYRLYLDVEVIFDREADFLYRQKGQTKLDNSVID